MRGISGSIYIASWIKKRCGTVDSGRTYLSIITRFFGWCAVAPEELASAWKKVKYEENYRMREQFIDEWTEKIEHFIYSNLEDRTPLTRNTAMGVIISFFKHHKIPVDPEYMKHAYVKFHNRDLKREEIRRVLENAHIRDRTFFLMMVESGLRPNTLVQLRYKHIKRDFETDTVPMMIELPSELLKDRVEARWTFIGEDAFRTLKEYLKPQIPLQNEDLIFQPERNDAKHPYLRPQTFSNKFRKIALKLGISEDEEKGKPRQIRLYGLRKYFMNNIRCDTAFREFWMAHKTTQTHYVSRDVERHREEYAKAYENLRIYKTIDSTHSHKIEEQTRKIEDQASRIEELEEKLKETKEVLDWMQKREDQGVIDKMAQTILENVYEEDEDMQRVFLRAMEKDLKRNWKRMKKKS